MSVRAARLRATPPLETLGDALGRLLHRPSEGWLTLLAAVVMVVMVGAVFVSAGWTPREFAGDSGFLLYVGPVGLVFGFLGAKVGWGRWRTHVVGALFAGIFLSLITGGLLLESEGTPVGWDPAGLAARMATTAEVARNIWVDFVVLHLQRTGESAHYHLVFGAIVWGAGLLAGYTIFGHRRPLDAVVVLGLVLLANQAATRDDQLPFLVTFSAAALLLLIRTHVFEEEVTWARRRIGEPGSVGRLYLNGGVAFVTVAVAASVLLTFTASSSPLQGFWKDLPRQLAGISQIITQLAPGGGNPNAFGGPTFGESVISTGQWRPSSATAFRVQLPQGESGTFKWRAGTYADYFGQGWERGPTTDLVTSAGGDLLAGLGDAPSPVGRRRVTITIAPDAYVDPTVVGPNVVSSVDVPTVTLVRGTDHWFATLESTEGLGTYSITALVPVLGGAPGELNEARLRTAGSTYPDEVRTLYLDLPAPIGPRTAELLETLRALVEVPDGFDQGNAYDLARTIETYLRSPENFQYNADIRGARDRTCGAASMAECFVILRQGYCEYFATTMAVMLRASDIPARIAYGFLPGERDDATGIETVDGSKAHWWVEVYFPGSGWVEFDPTGSVGVPQPLPSGSIGPSTPRPSVSFGPRSPRPSGSFTPGGGGTQDPTGTSAGPFIAIGLILIVGMAALALAALRRTPRNPMHPDQAWRSLARLATRFGLGPRPSQTVYEYAGALGDEVPTARVELTTIARAKVEVAYGRQQLETDRLKRIAQAYQRLRFALLGVVVRRGLRRGGGRRGVR